MTAEDKVMARANEQAGMALLTAIRQHGGSEAARSHKEQSPVTPQERPEAVKGPLQVKGC